MKAQVQSFTNPEKKYVVVVNGKKLTGRGKCSCPAWIFGSHTKDCKHLKIARKGFQGLPKTAVKILES